MQAFFDYLSQFHRLSKSSEDAIRNVASKRKLPKASFLVLEGKVCNSIYFLEKGAVRGFHNKDGKEVTYWFGFENTFITSLYSFISRKPALETIVLMEDADVIEIGYYDLQNLYDQYSDIERVGRLVDEHYYVMLEERMFSYMFRTAKERYDNLIESMPHILQRVPLGYIASYLGITQETLSRIRNKI